MAMDLSLPGLKWIRLQSFEDSRGSFQEYYQKNRYEDLGIRCDFAQDNLSISKKDVIRGMHFQNDPGQAKLISVIQGKIFDVVVDIRPDSPSFGKWEGLYLNPHEQLFIPVGFAHGFCVVSPEAHVLYKVSNLYDSQTEKGFRFDDPDLGITWPTSHPILSERDQKAPYFKELF
jgi:dTDP-4-dehydrorhamnose 3,5-epimerase